MKVALASVRFINNDVDYNISQLEKYMALASEKKASVICFGETFLQGFDSLKWNFKEDKQVAVSTDSITFKRVSDLTSKYRIDLMFGYIELDQNKLYSSYALVSEGVLIFNYKRISKGWKEFSKTDHHYLEGNEVNILNYQSKKCAIALCGDLWDYIDKFQLNQEILFWPVYVNFSVKEWNSKYLSEYCEQAKLVCKKVLLINSISENPNSFGGSFYIHNGVIKRRTDFGTEELLILDL
jgi:N-carbamoylputrescine amidase